MARFKGTDKLGEFIDNRQVQGNAFTLLSEADAFSWHTQSPSRPIFSRECGYALPQSEHSWVWKQLTQSWAGTKKVMRRVFIQTSAQPAGSSKIESKGISPFCTGLLYNQVEKKALFHPERSPRSLSASYKHVIESENNKPYRTNHDQYTAHWLLGSLMQINR